MKNVPMKSPTAASKIIKAQDAEAAGEINPKVKLGKPGSTTGAPKGQFGLPKSGKRSVVRM